MHLEAPREDVAGMLLLMLVIIGGPLLAGRFRVPGIIGLIIGGWLVGGPGGLELLEPGGAATIRTLGQIGLLYLMFNAGLELDLAVLRSTRRAAISFGFLSFALPQAIGTAVSLALGYDTAAAVLIGSLWASHTLVTYPTVRAAGIAGNRLVATTVGATAITDTLSLLVLAVVVAVDHGGSPGAIALTLGVGILAILVWCFALLSRLTGAFFAGAGRHRTLRFAWLLAAMLSAAVVSEVFGIEGIIGAFAAGAALNRLVPNEGPLMERVEFFGAALLIPGFLASVGLVIDPQVLIQRQTIVLAGVFLAVVVVGKLAAAVSVGRAMRGTRGEVGTMFGLSLSQAAATLAATFVGLGAGIVGDREVNAVLGVIVVSLIAASIITERSSRHVQPAAGRAGLGRRVLLARIASGDLPAAIRLARAIAAPDTGVVDVVVPVTAGDAATIGQARSEVAVAHESLLATGADGDVSLRVGESIDDAVASAGAERDATLLMTPWRDPGALAAGLFGARDRRLMAAGTPSLVMRLADAVPARVVLMATYRRTPDAAARAELELAADAVSRLGGALALPIVVLSVPGSGIDEVIADAQHLQAEGGGAAWLGEHAAEGDVVVVGSGLAASVASRAARDVVALRGVTILAATPAGGEGSAGILRW